MAEYIDKQKTLSTLENTAKYYEMPNADEWTKGIHYGLIHGVDNIIDNVPTADVIEREKIDKAIEEMERYSTSFEYANRHDLASVVDCCIGMIQKNIGEKK